MAGWASHAVARHIGHERRQGDLVEIRDLMGAVALGLALLLCARTSSDRFHARLSHKAV
jgi:hypothetical protein